jgi:hypothetical protein
MAGNSLNMLQGGPIFIALLAKLTFKINSNNKFKDLP